MVNWSLMPSYELDLNEALDILAHDMPQVYAPFPVGRRTWMVLAKAVCLPFQDAHQWPEQMSLSLRVKGILKACYPRCMTDWL
jgi:hypothetical protein